MSSQFPVPSSQFKKVKAIFLSFVVLAWNMELGTWNLLHADSPQGTHYQGRLADHMGNPLTGSYDLVFRVFSQESGGPAAIWTETRNGVSVQNGFFTVDLGTVAAIPIGLFSSASYYFEVSATTAGDVSQTLSPRARALSSPFAFHAYQMERATTSADFIVLTNSKEYFRVKSSGNVGIGTNNPATLLEVSGGTIAVPNGPTYSFNGDSNTGMGSDSLDTMMVVQNGSMRILVGTGGKVGIGTSVNSTLLTVGGAITTSATVTGAKGPNYTFLGDEDTGFYDHNADQLGFVTGGNLRALFGGGGKFRLGNGTSNGIFTLFGGSITVPNPGNPDGPEYSFNGDAGTGFYNSAPNILALATSGKEALRIDDKGRVGIGTDNPSFLLHVQGGTVAVDANATGAFGPNYSFASDLDTGFYSRVADNLNFSTFGIERLAIDAQGRVAVGVGFGPGANYLTVATTVTVAPGNDPRGPTYSFSGDTNTGFYAPNADAVAFAVNGQIGLRVDPASIVGFATGSPFSTMTVAGALQLNSIAAPANALVSTARFYYDSGLNALRVSLNGANYASMDPDSTDDQPNPIAATLNLDSIGADLGTTNQPGITISTHIIFGDAPNVIASTYSADTGFWDAVSPVRASSGSFVASGALGLGVSSSVIFGSVGGHVGIGTNNATRLFQIGTSNLSVTQMGFVGIGTINPATKLEVANGTITAPAGSTAGGPLYSFIGDTNTGMYNNQPNQLNWSTKGTQRMRIAAVGQVGIGTSNTVAGSFKLVVFGGTVTAPSGSGADAPVYSFDGDVNTGMYSPLANDLAFVTNGKERLRISNSGHVGINQVPSGDSIFLAVSGGTITAPAGGDSNGPVYSFSGDLDAGWYNPLSDDLAFVTSGKERMRINSTGNIGIGQNPDGTSSIRLTVAGGTITVPTETNAARPNPGYSFLGDVDTGFYSGAGDTLQLATGGQERWAINNKGYMALAAAAPDSTSNIVLNVSGGTLTVPSPGNASGPEYSFNNDMDTGFYSPGADQLGFATNGAERLRIDDKGRVGIGGAAVAGSSIKFEVKGGTLAAATHLAPDPSVPLYSFTGDENTGFNRNNVDVLGFITAGATRFNIQAGGGVHFGSGPGAGGKLVDIAGEVQIDFPTTGGTTIGVCKSIADGTAANQNLVECSATPADIAEWYETIPGIEAGDLVSFSDELTDYEAHGATYDGFIYSLGQQKISVLKKTSKPYQQNVIGVVSTAPIEIYGEDLKSSSKVKNPKPVALAGRVPIKVTTENGPIKPGDPLTSSSKPGYAMKASKSGRVVAIALEPFGEVQSSENSQLATRSSASGASGAASSANGRNSQLIREGKVLGFVNLGHWGVARDHESMQSDLAKLRSDIEGLSKHTNQNEALKAR